MSELAKITQHVADCHVNAMPLAFAEALNYLNWLNEQVKLAKATLESSMLEWIGEHGDLEIGEVRYYAGNKKTTKCTDVVGGLEFIMIHTGGSFEKLAENLSANPIKYGAFKALCSGDEFSKYFRVEEEVELKEGKPVRKLLSVNNKFLR